MTKSPALIARTTEDVLAMVPYVLGFEPSQSVVMLCTGEGQFHARVDLPGHTDDLAEFLSCLLDPVLRHDVDGVVLVVYTDDATRSTRVLRALHTELSAHGVTVHGMTRVDGTVFHPVALSHGAQSSRAQSGRAPEGDGVPFDPTSHPLRARSVLEGRVTHGSRDELADSLVGNDPAAVESVEDALLVAATHWAESRTQTERAWVRRVVSVHVAEGTTATDAEVARVLIACCDVRVRDEAWSLMTREDAAGHVAFWTDVVRRAPIDVLAAPSALLACAAWLTGHGALAWCALDRCAVAEPGYVMAELLGALLQHAVPPRDWESMRRELFGPAGST